MKISTSTQGLKRAEQQMNIAASRIARWGLPINGGEEGQTEPVDTVAITGEERSGLFARKPKHISLSDELIDMKTASFAFQANLGAIRSVLDMQDAVLEMTESDQETE